MTTIITRSALLFHGHAIADDVAQILIIDGARIVVTKADILARKRERQARELEAKRRTNPPRIYRLYIAHYGPWLMGGWQAMLDNRHESIWIDRDRKWLKPVLMRAFPLLLPFGGEYDQWHDWKQEFARQFRRRTQERKPVGVRFVRWDGRDTLEVIPTRKPQTKGLVT